MKRLPEFQNRMQSENLCTQCIAFDKWTFYLKLFRSLHFLQCFCLFAEDLEKRVRFPFKKTQFSLSNAEPAMHQSHGSVFHWNRVSRTESIEFRRTLLDSNRIGSGRICSESEFLIKCVPHVAVRTASSSYLTAQSKSPTMQNDLNQAASLWQHLKILKSPRSYSRHLFIQFSANKFWISIELSLLVDARILFVKLPQIDISHLPPVWQSQFQSQGLKEFCWCIFSVFCSYPLVFNPNNFHHRFLLHVVSSFSNYFRESFSQKTQELFSVESKSCLSFFNVPYR